MDPLRLDMAAKGWATALRQELAQTPVTEALAQGEAEQAAASAWEAVGTHARAWLATTLMKDAAELRSDGERRERAEKNRAEERARRTDEAKRALEKLYGGKIAKAVEAAGLFAEYRVGEVEGVTLAIRADRLAELVNRLPTLKLGDRQVPGYRLGTLAQRIHAVAADDLEPAVALVRDRRSKRQAEERERHAAVARGAAREREKARTKRTFGVELD